MPALQKSDLQNRLKSALEAGRSENNGSPTDDQIAEKLADAIGEWLNNHTLVLPGDGSLVAPSGAVTGTIQILVQ